MKMGEKGNDGGQFFTPREWSAAQMIRIMARAVERAFRLLCRHSWKNAGEDAGMAGRRPALRIERDDWLAMDSGRFLRRTTRDHPGDGPRHQSSCR
jgi:hypothetical protein